MSTEALSREDAVEALAAYGIEGKFLYLIDIIPLIEMIWADGKAQDGEIKILSKFITGHVNRINKNAGFEYITFDTAKDFALSFLRKRPDAKLLQTLRQLSATLINSASQSESAKESLLVACLDIASSAVIEYPYALGERFDLQEKKCFFEIVADFPV